MNTNTTSNINTIANNIQAQVGSGNILSICGGKRKFEVDGNDVSMVMSCGSGYKVRVRYVAARDTYTVTREFARGLNYWIKGEREDVYCYELAEVAYRAGMFRDEWTTNGARKVI